MCSSDLLMKMMPAPEPALESAAATEEASPRAASQITAASQKTAASGELTVAASEIEAAVSEIAAASQPELQPELQPISRQSTRHRVRALASAATVHYFVKFTKSRRPASRRDREKTAGKKPLQGGLKFRRKEATPPAAPHGLWFFRRGGLRSALRFRHASTSPHLSHLWVFLPIPPRFRPT